ncbi:proteasome subunit beta [Nanoarchaeota archaeon]
MEQEIKKTGTTTVGIVCTDGVVLAADMRATAGNMIMHKNFEKVIKVNDNIVVTTAGVVSDVQLLVKLVRAELRLKQVRTNRLPTIKESANLLGGLLYSNIRKYSLIPGIAHFLMGGKDNDGVHLYDLAPDGSVAKIDDFFSSGSGSVFTFGVLESQYDAKINIQQGIELAEKCIKTALERDSASGNGFIIYSIKMDGITKEKEQNLKLE